MQANELKSLRVDELLLKRRSRMAKLQTEINKLEKESDKNNPNGEIPGVTIAMAQQIAHLNPEEQQKVLQTYAMFRSIDQNSGRRDSMLPFLVQFSKQNPGTTQSDMVTYAKAMSDQFKTGIEAMKTVMPQREKTANSIEVLKLFKDLVSDSLQKPMDELVKKVQHQPGVFEQILTNPDLYNRAKEIGIFGGRESKTGNTETDLKIAQITSANQLEIKKMDLEWRKSLLENESKDRRADRMLGMIGPLAAMFSGSIDEKMRDLGRGTAATHNPTQTVPTPTNSLHITCSKCGYDEETPMLGSPPEQIPCPGCGASLNIGASPVGDT